MAAGGDGIRGSFTTEKDGNAFITASSIKNKDNKDSWSGVIFEGDSGQIYGSSIILDTNAEIPNGKTLTIEDRQTLTISNGTTLTNNGTIQIDRGGTLENKGTLTGNGTFTGDGEITGTKLTQGAPNADEGYTINCADETVSANKSYEVSSDQSNPLTDNSTIAPGATLYVRKAVSNFYDASDWTPFTVDERPASPTGLQGENTSSVGESGGKITGLDSSKNYQISSDGGAGWTDAILTGTEITGLTAGSYQVRVKAVENSSFASASAVVILGGGAQRTYTVTVNSGTGGGKYAESATVTITATIPDAQRFTGWTVNEGGVTLANASIATTTFTMPAQAVTVTANFQSNSNGGSSSSNGGGSYTPPTYPPTVERPSEGGGTTAVSPSNPKLASRTRAMR